MHALICRDAGVSAENEGDRLVAQDRHSLPSESSKYLYTFEAYSCASLRRYVITVTAL